jgi:acyl-CoA thioester hydrolase
MTDAFAAEAASSLVVAEHHLRFLKEAQAGAALHMVGGIVEMGETTATLLQVLIHSRTGEPAASAVTRVVHAAPTPLRPFSWPRRAKEAAASLRAQMPAYAGPRSIKGAQAAVDGADAAETRASLAEADALGLQCIARGTITPKECDVFGRMRTEEFIGRVSDGIPALLSAVRSTVGETSGAHVRRLGGAVLEYRLLYFDWPYAGDHLEVRSGLAEIGDKTQRLIHWLLDPVSGRAWGAAEAVAVNFDLDARKVVPISPEARARLNPALVPGLRL